MTDRPASPPKGATDDEYRPTNPPPPEVHDPDERADDELIAESRDQTNATAWATNLKESFDIHRDDERFIYRLMALNAFREIEQTRRESEEMFHERRMRSLGEWEQRMDRRDQQHAITWNPQQALRDQARDSQSGLKGGDKTP